MKISKEQQSVIAIVCALLFVAWIKHSYSWAIAAILVFSAMISAVLTSYIHKLWMGMAKILGVISSHIILFILFYMVLTPIALIKRWVTGQNSMLKFDRSKSGNFIVRNHMYEPADLSKPW